MIAAKKIVTFGKESSWGVAAPATTTVLLEGSGLKTPEENEFLAVKGNASFPAITSQEVVSRRFPLTFDGILHPTTFQGLVQQGWTRTSGLLDSYTWYKKDDYKQRVYAGCKVNTCKLAWSANELVRLTLEMLAKSGADTTGIVAGTYPSGAPYKGAMVTFSINGVTASAVESGEITVSNGLQEGPPEGSSYARSYLDESYAEITGNVKLKFASAALDTLVNSLSGGDVTAFPAIVTFQHASGNAILTFAAGTLKAKSNAKEYGDQGTTVMQTFEIVHGVALPTWTYPT